MDDEARTSTESAAPLPGESGDAVRPETQKGAAMPDALSGILSDPAFLARLPQMMAVLKPMLGAIPASPGTATGTPTDAPASALTGIFTGNPTGIPTGNPAGNPTGTLAAGRAESGSQQATPPTKPQTKPLADCRDDLLLALKPFLSPERREAVDSILRISRLGQVLRQIR